MSDLTRRLLGDRDRLGWWTLPVFLLVGLIGAVLAGSLTAVYFGQQVDALEDETRDARQRAEAAAAEVDEARERALTDIDEQVTSVREALTREFPFDDVADGGVVTIRAFVGASAPEGAAPSGDAGDTPAVQDTPAPESTTSGTAAAEPPPTPVITERVGSGFAVASESDTTFFATTMGVVADPDAPGGVVQQIEVTTAGGTFPGTVHSWDAGRDLAIVRAAVSGAVIPAWRSSQTPVALGERVVVAGATPTANGVQVAGQVGFLDVTVLVTDLPELPFLAGAPIVDADGHVVGVHSLDYRPFGPGAGDRQSAVPVRLLCERMLRDCDALEAPPAEPEG